MTLPTPPSSIPSPKAKAFTDRAKASGRCTPSLIPNETELSADVLFLSLVSNLVHDGPAAASQNLILKNGDDTGKDFLKAVEMVQNIDAVTINVDIKMKTKVLTQRRAILLLIIGCTPSNNDALKYILNNNLLIHVKAWLEDILNSKVGGVDLLLHLLSSISMLPVTKIMVTSSKLGKKVAAVEKHKICVGGMNEQAIKERVSKVKEQWSASAKRSSAKGTSTSVKKKRSLDSGNSVSMPSPKKVKSGDGAKKSSLSSLLQQVSGTQNNDTKHDIPKKTTVKAAAATNTSFTSNATSLSEPEKTVTKEDTESNTRKGKKNENRRIRWADADGGPLKFYHSVENKEDMKRRSHVEGKEDSKRRSNSDGKESWKDRKKRDRLKEKELIQKARKFKLVDKDDNLDTMAMIFSSKWHQPKPLPPDTENPPLQINSQEIDVQIKRTASVMQVSYLSEDDVPSNPYPLTETEQTMDFNAQSTSVPQIIPFFFPQQLPTPAPAPLPAPLPVPLTAPLPPPEKPLPLPSLPPPLPPTAPPPPIVASSPTAATIDVVRSMGLPDFLVGQNIQALQGLIASPGLLNSFVDVNGNYDQLKIMSFIQVMNQQLQRPNMAAPPVPPPIVPPPVVPPPVQPPPYGHYGNTQSSQYKPIPQASTYKPPVKLPSGGYRGDQNNTEGNLHLSGYGPTTSTEELLAMFAPYVKVNEVVPKNGFMFLNTNDPDGAKRAREALHGVMIGGCPLRINVALRRNKNPALMNPSINGTRSNQPPTSNPALPKNALGQIDFNAVRDDRGNPATKNLFVAGYGQGTTEQQLRDVFSLHTQVTGVVMKSSFSFVNTSEKNSAVLARQALLGSALNGGSLRINFAKESGRLGTSFDTNYGAQPKRSQGIPNHYGHSY